MKLLKILAGAALLALATQAAAQSFPSPSGWVCR